MKSFALVFVALGTPLVGWNLAVAEAASLDVALETAKQVPALVVLTWMTSKFLAFLRDRDSAFADQIKDLTEAYRSTAERSAEAINENTRATTKLYGSVEKLEERLR